jgi:hypothetical protein
MMSMFCSELIIFKAENADFQNTILRYGKTASKFQKLPPLHAFYLTGSLENQNFMPGLCLRFGHISLDLSALPFYISISI